MSPGLRHSIIGRVISDVRKDNSAFYYSVKFSKEKKKKLMQWNYVSRPNERSQMQRLRNIAVLCGNRAWKRINWNELNLTYQLMRFYIFFLQRYVPFSFALASLIIHAHSSLPNAFVLHRFTPSFLKSSSTSFSHLSLGRPLPLLPSNFPLKVFFTDLVLFICTSI